jgi:hypothetical protein
MHPKVNIFQNASTAYTAIVYGGIPSQRGKAGGYLATNGRTLIWADAPKGGSFNQMAVAATTFTVTIGGTQPTTGYTVGITPSSVLAAANYYVTNKTNTTFDVVYTAPITGLVQFDWILLP